VAETWDGRLNDIHGRHVKEKHVFEALDTARSGAIEEGNVGGGTGMVCHRFKGGIGTASRKLASGYTLGVIVQANYGLREDLTIGGIRVGRQLPQKMPILNSLAPGFEGNSIIVIVATDAPLLPHQLRRVAKRVSLGIGKTGGFGSNSSGDLFLAFSTATTMASGKKGVIRAEMLQNDAIDPVLKATVQATEESVNNALIAAKDMEGINGSTVFALPQEELVSILKHHRVLTK
jgi:L-aminopeptidase/D-esterase-like protein